MKCRSDAEPPPPRPRSARSEFLSLLVVIGVGACASAAPQSPAVVANQSSNIVDERCTFKSAPTVVMRDGNAVLEVFQFEEEPVFAESVIPSDPALAAYRQAIIDAGANVIRPVADAPAPKTKEEEQMWQREANNAEVAFSGRAGQVRSVQCLEALFFARQNRRYSEITHPTEFIASVLRKTIDGREFLKAYLSGSDQMFPPKGLYGFDEVEKDIGNGWSFWFVLHNHTVQENSGLPALGTPTLSTSDVDLHRGLAERLGLRSARVTNGFFTVEIPATAFAQYFGRDPGP